MATEKAFYITYPVFKALSENPNTQMVVRPLLARYAGMSGLKEFDEIQRELRSIGKTHYEATNIALGIVTTKQDDKVLIGFGAPLSGWFKDFITDPKRVVTAVATGGASEGLRAASKSAYDKLMGAVDKGWGTFEDQVKETLKSFKKIRSVRDALSILKLAVSGGVSVMADSGMAALNDMMYDLLAPYMKKLGQVIGGGYAKGKAAVKKGVKHAFRNANKVVRNIFVYIVDTLYDLALGYPPCVLEEGCIKPVATGLSNSGVPYVKAIGEALKAIYPIVQGTVYNSPETSQALYAYAGGKGSNGAMMLPSAKLPSNFSQTLVKVLEAFDEEYSMGVPKSFERYKPWLIDMVARGHRGPTVMAGHHTPKYYFYDPKEAQAVLKKANMLSAGLEWADKYLKWINRAWTLGKKAYDMYQAMDMEDFSFDADEWQSEDFGAYIKKKALDVQVWAADTVANAGEYAKEAAVGYVDAQKARLQKELFQIQKTAGEIQSTASGVADAVSSGELPDFSEAAKRLSETKLPKFKFMPGKLGAVDIATATMAEWQPAMLGLMARARWNDMALKWLKLTPAQRDLWKTRPPTVWRDTGIDYPAWHKRFSESPKMRKMDIAYNAHKLGFQAAAGAYLSSIMRGVASSGILKEVVNAQGKKAGINNIANKVRSTLPVVIRVAAKTNAPVRLAPHAQKLQVIPQVIIPEPILQAEHEAGLDKSSMKGPWIALGAAGVAVAFAAAVTRR